LYHQVGKAAAQVATCNARPVARRCGGPRI